MEQNSIQSKVDLHFRKVYGKLFASLLALFGSNQMDGIEDAIQSAFYKALKSWKVGKIPEYPDRWLYTVAKNHLLDQIKTAQRESIVRLESSTLLSTRESKFELQDDRLKTLVLCTNLVKLRKITATGQSIFVLKNICGLSIAEISSCLSLREEAVYKRHQRTKQILQNYSLQKLQTHFTQSSKTDIAATESIIYALFNAGYDSLRKSDNTPVNDEVCFAAFSLAKLLLEKHKKESTSNLIALFCFHLARVPARFKENKLVSFFKQDRTLWNDELLQKGFGYLVRPPTLNRYHLEAIITSKHMTTSSFDSAHWQDILVCYDRLLLILKSPIVSMNRAFVLYKLDRTSEALQELENIQGLVPEKNLYYSLIMGELLSDTKPEIAKNWYLQAANTSMQTFRRDHIERIIRRSS